MPSRAPADRCRSRVLALVREVTINTNRKAVAFVAVANVTRAASLAASMFVLARALGPTGRGEVAAALAPMTAASAAFSGGLPDAVSHFVARFPDSARAILRRSLSSGLILGLLGALAVAAIAGPLSAGRSSLHTMMVWVGLATLPSIWVVILRAHASGQQNWKRVSSEAIIAGGAQVVGLIALWAIGELDVHSALIVMALGTAVGGVAYLSSPVAGHLSPVTRADDVSYSILWKFSGGAWLGAVGMVGLTYLDQMLMTPLASIRQLGIYALAINISSLLSVVTVSIRSVVLVNESSAVNFERLARHARFSLIVCLAFAAVAAATLPILIPVVFGSEYQDSVVPAIILLPPLVVTASGSVATAGLMALGRPWLRSVSIAFGMVLNAILIVLLVPSMGAVGAALAMLASGIPPFMSIIFLRIYYRRKIADFLIPRRSDLRAIASVFRNFAPAWADTSA